MAEAQEKLDRMANEEDLARYVELGAEIKALQDERNILNKVIKTFFRNEPGKYQIGDYVANLYEQDKSKMDEERLVELLKSKGLHDCLKVVMTYDEAKVEEALYKGQLTKEELDSCIITIKPLALLVKKVKNGGSKKASS